MSEQGLDAGSLRRWAETADAAGATAKKLEKRALLAGYLAGLAVEDAERAALYLAGVPFAETDSRKLNVGGATLTKAVLGRTGATDKGLALAFRRQGDVGSAAWELMGGEPEARMGPRLCLADLEETLAALAAARGPAAKLQLLGSWLERADALETRYVLKLLSGDMRIGVKQALVEEAIAAAYERPLAGVRHAVMLTGSLPEAVRRAAEDTLGGARMRLFHPLGFMLASPVETVEEAVARFREELAEEGAGGVQAGLESEAGDARTAVNAEVEAKNLLPAAALREAQVEDKYDGIRVQLHVGDAAEPGRVGLFSRSREDLSAAFPELMEAFAGMPEAAILDGEVLGWQPGAPAGAETAEAVAARALPFASLQGRLGRKVVPDELRRTVPVVFMAFDLLYADGRLWLEEPLAARRERLRRFVEEHGAQADGRRHAGAAQAALFGGGEGRFTRLLLAPAMRLESAEQLDAAYGEARARGNEGVMLKAAGSHYQPGRRGLAWLKLKRELATLDVVVTAAEYGHGRRAGFLSDYTFAVRGPEWERTGELVNIGKAYSGITDVEMESLSRHFHETTVEDRGHVRLVEPDTALEVAFNNVMRSDRHNSGFALRFPRIVRIRTDKPVGEIDTLERVEAVWRSQPDL